MISFNRKTKIFVSKAATDMRASYDTLFAKVQGVLNQDPLSGHLFVFINSKRSSIKCLFFDGTGVVLLCKRLERGTFSKLNPYFQGEVILTAAEFALFFEGADFSRRFIDSPSEIDKKNRETLRNKKFSMSHDLQTPRI